MLTPQIFIFREMQRFSSHSLTMEPNLGWVRIHACILGDDLAKQAAASKTKGTVGITGRSTPIKARRMKNIPRRDQKFIGHHQFKAI